MLVVLYINLSEGGEEVCKEVDFASLVGENAFQEVRSIRNLKSRTARLWGEALRNYGLKIYWGIDAGAYTFIRGAHGKPYIKERKDIFSMYHILENMFYVLFPTLL